MTQRRMRFSPGPIVLADQQIVTARHFRTGRIAHPAGGQKFELVVDGGLHAEEQETALALLRIFGGAG